MRLLFASFLALALAPALAAAELTVGAAAA